jgi:DNA-binding YbaB/EbfC family protein
MEKLYKEKRMDINLLDLFKNLKNMQETLNQVQQQMKSVVVTGSAGGEMVKIEMNCAFELIKVSISPEGVDPQDIKMLEDLILAAFNNAIANAKEKLKENAGPLASGLNFPFGIPGQ